jgi:PKD repeat protein
MDVSYTTKTYIKHPLSVFFFIFFLLLISSGLWAQTVTPLSCGEPKSWIARWTISSITGGFVPYKMTDGDKTTCEDVITPGPWTYDINFGIVRSLTGVKLYQRDGLYSLHSFQIFVSTDNITFSKVNSYTLNYTAGAYENDIQFGGYVNAKYVRIVVQNAWQTPTTFNTTRLRIWEANFMQCGVDPIRPNPIQPVNVIAPTLSCSDAISKDIQGTINTYYSGQSDAIKGSASLNIDLSHIIGTHILVPGDRVLIMQMQNALISETNSPAYGDGVDNDLIASGWIDVRNTGEYEFAIVESVSGNNIHFTQPLQKNYYATGVYQLVYCPVYDNVTITGTIKAADWDGYCGGIVTFDSKTLNLNNQSIDVSSQGFRKGAMNSNTDTTPYYWGTYCTDKNDYFGEKGEGIAGAPRGTYPNSKRMYSLENTVANTGGSFGRGAPGNAGGSGVSHNSGGGGGANIGSGGQGGASYGGADVSGDMTRYWDNISPNGYTYSNLNLGYYPNGGMGGTGSGSPDPFRIWMGGAGGGGHQNNNAASGGSNGGGIILATSRVVNGVGHFYANGMDAGNSLNDGAGGGGAGGTIVFGFEVQSNASITYSAKGGNGGSVNYSVPHGPAGGGGGGAIIVTAAPSTGIMDITGGKNGVHIPSGSPWGANKGDDGNFKFADLSVLYTYPCDHGDAPLSFGDAAHQLKPDMPSLKTPGDAEPYALNQPPHDRDALGDDLNGIPNDEDGVYLPFDTLSTAQSFYKIKINVRNTKDTTIIVSGWIDFNGNGTFDDNERVTIKGLISGDTTLIWKSFPSDITGGESYARFRISTGNEALVPTGVAPDGEAEDYTIYINAQPHAVPDTTCTHQDRTIKIPVVANDKIQGDKHGYITVKIQPPNGTATPSDNGTPNDKTDDYILYTPKPGFQGVDTLTYELWNAIGNSEAAKVTITVKEPVTTDFTATPPNGCTPLDVAFTNLSTEKNANFTWDFGDGSPVSHAFDTVHTFKTGNSTTVYNVKLTMNTGCGIFDTTKQVTVHPLPHAVFTEKSNDDRPEIVVFTDVSKDVARRVWTVDGLIVGSDSLYTAKFDSAGPHIITLRVFNEFDCYDDTTRVHTTIFRGLYVPNTFIPGSSDHSINTFIPVGRGVVDYTILIFDLWGNMIWSSNLLNNNGSPLEGWDGNDKHGKPYPTGAYIWRIKAVLEGNKLWKGMEIPYKSGSYHTQGTITIIR